MTPAEFINKWERVTLKESAADREHFLDLCALIGHPTPAEDDPHGESFTFQKSLKKVGGGQGYADVWKRGYFAWEYKDKLQKDLNAAYEQIKFYTDALENPPLLITCDLDRFEVHTNFTNTSHEVRTFRTRDLDRPEILQLLRDVFHNPDALRPGQVIEQVTKEAAERLGALAEKMAARGVEPERAAHFLMQCVFCMFAEDVGLLPDNIFAEIVRVSQGRPELFKTRLNELFAAMATGGDAFLKTIPWFNGGLFENIDIPDPDGAEIMNLGFAARMDWKTVEPAIFGTLFERSLDPAKRKQRGAHYTDRGDILLVVEPVVMEPLRREWDALRAQWSAPVGEDAEDPAPECPDEAARALQAFVDRLGNIRILDPACGSGNFLYVALNQMLNLEREVRNFAFTHGLPDVEPRVSPRQLFGLEIDPYAHQLAQLVVWIGFLQWKHFHAEPMRDEPILKPLDTIRRTDAVLDLSTGTARPTQWPDADIIIGNPPFLGGKRMKGSLGDSYVEALFRAHEGRVPPEADFVCYWFEQAREQIAQGKAKRAGLLATNSIRGGKNRRVLERIKDTGGIYMAWSDRKWILDGAAVRISIVGFDNAEQADATLDGERVNDINPDLTADTNLTRAQRLPENAGVAFIGPLATAPFDIPPDVAHAMLRAPLNVNGHPNGDVVRPYMNGRDIVGRPRGWFAIDFAQMPMDRAAEYEMPFEYVKTSVLPWRVEHQHAKYRVQWWQFSRPRPELRAAIAGLGRYIGTPRVAKHRLFVWLEPSTLANEQVVTIARDDDYTFGVLHSRAHEVWALRMGTALEDRPRYTPTTCFETFPFPHPTEDQRAVAAAAKALDDARRAALNNDPKLTLTALYNKRPTWLHNLHAALDRAVYDAYGWPDDPTETQILERLLTLNLERAG